MASPAADRNLLLGILALQLGFVTPDQLVSAMQTWVTNKSMSLAEIFRDLRFLNDSQSELLKALVAEHILQHENDTAKSLCSVSSLGPVRVDLSQIHDTDLQASLTLAASQCQFARLGRLDVERPAEALSGVGHRFRILRPHDEGGLGKVWLAMDKELNREVALKEIKPDFGGSDAHRVRFVLEAEITGGLEHPGIVPVYGLGHYTDGRPYYAMRFIRGDSLRKAIAKFHEADWTRCDPGDRALEFQRLLRRFLDVCNAIHYAHRRGILHRDLKPGNIMLGEYGETLVVDWGLAKVLGRSPMATEETPESQPVLLPRSGSHSDLTIHGSVIGSPAYMSPEQARGEHDLLGVETDVYSLGATLYTLLTNTAPVDGKSGEEVIERVRTGQWTRPRQISPLIPKPVEAICMKAMALEPASRFASARALAVEIERFLADEPTSAYCEGLVERAARLIRRNRSGALWGAASLLVITILSVISALFVNSARRDTELALIEQRKARSEAASQRERADMTLAMFTETMRSPDPWVKGKDVKVVDVLKQFIDERLRTDRMLPPSTRAQLLTAVGTTCSNLDLPDLAIPLLEEATQYLPKPPNATDIASLRAANALAVAYHKAGRLPDAMQLYEEAFDSAKRIYGRVHPETLICLNNLANGLQDTGRISEAIALFEEVVDARRRLFGDSDHQTLNALNNLAMALLDAQRAKDALRPAEEALKGRREIFGTGHPLTLASLSNYASALRALGRVAEAVPLFEEVHQKRSLVLGPEHSETIGSINNLGEIYVMAGRPQEAIPLLKTAYERRCEKLGPNHKDSMQVASNLGRAYDESGDVQAALPFLQTVLAWRRSNLGSHSRETLGSINALALALKHLQRVDEAIPLYEEAVQVGRGKYGDDDLDVLNFTNNLARAYHDAGRLRDAIPLLRDTLERRRRLLGEQHRDSLTSMNNLALALVDDGHTSEAIPMYEAVVHLGTQAYGPNHPYQLQSITNLGVAYVRDHQPEKGLHLLSDHWPLVKTELGVRHRLALSTGLELANALLRLKKWEKAEAVLREVYADFQAEMPEHWTTARVEVLLGEAMFGRGLLNDAESLLADGVSRLLEQQMEIHPARRERIVNDAMDQIVQVYEALQRPEEAQRWREKRTSGTEAAR